MTRLTIALALLLLVPGAAPGQTSADSAAIIATAMDYIEGYYTGDGDRMDRALHPDLAKRMTFADPASGASQLNHMNKAQLVAATRSGYGARVPAAVRRMDITILDIYENAASVKVVAHDWIDYLHVMKFDGDWVIINVLWELTPAAKAKMGGG